jgi:hypothetical protein
MVEKVDKSLAYTILNPKYSNLYKLFSKMIELFFAQFDILTWWSLV